MREPDNSEGRRLATLHELSILDTEASPAIDGLVEAAAALCNVPIALVTLLDRRRQWFKSNYGLEEVSQTEREIALCDHAIRSPGVMIVEDARTDPRFTDNPLVTGELNLRFYAGAPLIAPNGERLGALCVLGQRPGSLEFGQIMALQRLADAVVRFLYAESASRYPAPGDHQHDTAKAGRKDVILDEAMRVLSEEGAAAFSARKVAKSAGISLGHLQHHYPSKIALIRATVNACFKRLNRYYEAAIAPIPNPVDRLVATARYALCGEDQGRLMNLLRQFWAIAEHDHVLARSLNAFYARCRRLLATVLRQANPELSMAASLQRAAAAISLLSGAFLNLPSWSNHPGDDSFSEYVLANLVRLPY